MASFFDQVYRYPIKCLINSTRRSCRSREEKGRNCFLACFISSTSRDLKYTLADVSTFTVLLLSVFISLAWKTPLIVRREIIWPYAIEKEAETIEIIPTLNGQEKCRGNENLFK